jgi:hypothetical protein
MGCAVHGERHASLFGQPGPWCFQAIASGDILIFDFLLQHGVDVNREWHGTACDIARDRGHDEIVEILCSTKAD